MTQPDFILQFLRSPTWQAHKIASTYEAFFDMLATPPDTLPNTVEAFSKRWKVHRDTARKFLNEALQMVQVSNIEEFRQMLKEIGTNAEYYRHSSLARSRVNEDNINALSNDKAEREKGVRVREERAERRRDPTASGWRARRSWATSSAGCTIAIIMNRQSLRRYKDLYDESRALKKPGTGGIVKRSALRQNSG